MNRVLVVLGLLAVTAVSAATTVLLARAKGDDATPTALAVDLTPDQIRMPDTPVVTQDGTELAFSEALGPGAYIIGFTYTKCPAICGATELDMQFVAASRADLDTPLRLVTLTLDPQNDTPQVLATAHSAAGAPPEWVRLTGRPSDIMRLLGYLGAWDGRPLKEHKQVFIVGNTSSGRNSRLSVEEVGYDPERLLAIAASYAAS